ncbi:MAG: hypothetical protein ACXVNN_08040 [Bacteroidia bacterium]
MILFLKDRRYTDTWLLYLGSAIFLICIFTFGIIYGGKKNDQTFKVYNGFVVTTLGVIFSCVLIFLLTLLFAPGVFNIGSANDVLRQTPPALSKKNSYGLLFTTLANAVIINFCAGTFATVLARGKTEENKLPSNG